MDDNIKLKLKRVLAVLVEQSADIKDDTCLNKLIDFLNSNLQQPEDVDSCCIINFLRCVIEKKTSSSVLVFSIHLSGILGLQPLLNTLYGSQVVEVLQTAMSYDFLEVPSVGEAFYKVLSLMPTQFIIQIKGLMSKTRNILQKRCSLFLTKSTVQFVTSYFIKHNDDADQVDDLLMFLDKLCWHVERMASENQEDQTQFSAACFDILKDVIVLERWNRWIFQKFPVFNDTILTNLEAISDIAIFDSCLICLFVALQRTEKKHVEEFGIKLMNTVNTLMKTDVRKGQNVCFSMMKSGLWPEHFEWIKFMVSLPLYLLVAMESVPEKIQLSVRDINVQITSRTKAVKVFCGTIEKLAELNLKDKQIQEMVVQSFELTIDEITTCRSTTIHNYLHGSTTCHSTTIHNYLQGSNKIQQKCLQLFVQDHTTWIPYIERIVKVVMNICQNSRLDNVTYTKCLDCILLFLPHIDRPADLSFMLQKHLCGIDWEAREATISFIQKVIVGYGKADSSLVLSWLMENRFDVSVWQALSDSESYVRSTAVDSLKEIILCPPLLDHLLKNFSMNLDTVVSEIENLCIIDTEAFVRRSAAGFLTKLWEDNLLLTDKHKQSILTLMSGPLVRDFDWEVKMKVLDFWSYNLDRVVCAEDDISSTAPSYAVKNCGSFHSFMGAEQLTLKSKFCKLVLSGGVKALFCMSEDFDQSVVGKALLLIKKVKEIVNQQNFLPEIHSFLDKSQKVMDITEKFSDCKRQKLDLTVTEKIVCEIENGQKEEIILSVEKLLTFDVEERLAVFSETCDEYDRNPESLLDDILLYAGSHAHDEEDDSTVIDCY